MTTFTSRKLVRDKIASLFAANSIWTVYSGFPGFSELAGQSPLCTVVSGGTSSQFEGKNKNPRIHRFTVTNWVLYSQTVDGWTYAMAEDLLDELEVIGAQIIRDNTQVAGFFDYLRFEPGFSDISRVPLDNGDQYVIESRVVVATLSSGAV